LPLLIVFLPGFSKLLGHEMSHRMDLFFWVTALTLGSWVMVQVKSPLFLKVLFLTVASLSIGFFINHREDLFHFFMLVMALVQLGATLHKHRSQKLNPPCCAHEACEKGTNA
jgi:hypothetical protein